MSSLIIFDNGQGKLVKEKSNDYWEGEYEFKPNHKIRIVVEIENEMSSFPTRFQDFIEYATKKDADIRAFVSKKLLSLYNETWKDVNDAKITELEFAKRIKLNTISFDEEKENVSVYYDDVDLFAGHEIKVDILYDGTILKADLP